MSNKTNDELVANRLKLRAPQESYERTLRRLEKIQNHLKRPRGDRLKDKVVIITGVGSLKGIGLVVNWHISGARNTKLTRTLVNRRATALLYAHEGEPR